jgi:DNA (cytosine-5)-methyltransferase 1
MKFKLGELFCGPGGIALGSKEAIVVRKGKKYSIEHEWANDYDQDTCMTYIKNICPNQPSSVICEDVRSLNIDNLSPIDDFAFGFPCNDFSIVGEQKGFKGTFGPLYSYGIKVIKKFKPKFFIAENVGGLKNNNEGKAFQTIIDELIDEGYDVVANLYKFENYEIPQSRHRIIIVGIRKDLGLTFKVPVIKNPRVITCREAIENPPIHKDAYNNELTKQSHNVVERLKHIKPGENAFNASIPEHLKLNVKGAQISQIYKRLDPLKPAYTVTGSGGGGTHIYHWCENRSLTNRERARLQTFPDNFIFHGSKESVRKQIGMAVPPKGAKIVFEAILKTFAGVEYESIEPNIQVNNRDLFGNLVLEPSEEYLKSN